MNNFAKQKWGLVLLKGIILIVLALIIFNNPADTLLSIALFIGLGFIITGIVIIVVALATKKENENFGWKLAEGLLDILFGFVLAVNPEITAAIIPFMIGFWAMFYGILLTVSAFNSVKFNATILISGILIIILGYVIMFNPLIFGLTISIWIGITLLFSGIANIIFSFQIKSLNKELSE